jgi:hypothetical protein
VYNRESYNIKRRLKGRKSFKNKVYFIFLMIRKLLFNRYYRKLILLDNIYTPFNRLIRCKILPHKYIKSDEDFWWCTKCNHILQENDYIHYIRKLKLLKIKDKI